MKILFLQKVDNANGGVTNVNINLTNYFLSCGCEVDIVSLRHGDSWEIVKYPVGANNYLVNEKDVWGCPRLKDVLDYMKHGRIVLAIKTLVNRTKYKRKMSDDYNKCQELIEKLAPNVIINSHYETLFGISEEYLRKTVMHFHTSFDQVLENRSYLKIFNNFTSKIHSFVWLSERTKQEAIKFGYKNSKCIYNPLMFSAEDKADMSSKKIVFIGRMSEEKRVPLAIEYFREVISENNISDWRFEIYGDGELAEEIEALVKNEKHVSYMGRTENVQKVLLQSSIMVLTSSFEGMPLVVLEANECGVPVIAYDFGESSSEIISNKNTGLIVQQNDKKAFKDALLMLMKDDEYRNTLSFAAKEYVKKFAKENIGNQWFQLFEDINDGE